MVVFYSVIEQLGGDEPIKSEAIWYLKLLRPLLRDKWLVKRKYCKRLKAEGGRR